jgi:hypothetical protein
MATAAGMAATTTHMPTRSAPATAAAMESTNTRSGK